MGFNDLLKFLEEEEKGLVSMAMKLIKEDAPKNKFSIVAGKMAMIEEVRAKIESIQGDSR